MDYIVITSLRLRGKHGAYKEERRVEQEFEISVRLGYVPRDSVNDTLANAIDYDGIRSKIRNIIGGNSRYLVETLAEKIAESIFEDPRVQNIELTICKPEVWENGTPGVTIFRERKK